MRAPFNLRIGPVRKTKVAAALEAANRARDAGNWKQAVVEYTAAISAGHSDPAIRIQLGNALKESGDLLSAETAYRKALAAHPNNSDAWLQLGHVLKLLGRRELAAQAYERALSCDALQGDAAAELIALGVGWRITEVSVAGRSLLYDTMAAVQELRRTVTLLESRLPAIESLAAVPLHRYDLFIARYHPRAPMVSARLQLDVLILPHADAPAQVIELLGALSGRLTSAQGVVGRIFVMTADDRLRDLAARHLRGSMLVSGSPLLSLLAEGAPTDWVLVADGPTDICATAPDWFAYAAAQVGPDCLALICDEVLRESPEAIPQPILLPGFDPQAMAAVNYRPSLFAVRRAMLNEVPVVKAAELLSLAAERGRVVHVPRLLAERRHPTSVRATVAPPQGPARNVRIIIPTREAGALLDRCIEAAQQRAARPDLLSWTIIDNHSGVGPSIVNAPPGTQVLRCVGNFNWSAFNNLAAESATEELLFFLNDDVQLLTQDWDLCLAGAFTDPRVAAAGLRLLYPDGRVQHAGVVLGQNDRTEHEARGVERWTPGPLHRWITRRRAAAVTGAALVCRSGVFRECGGFDSAELPIWFNDIDICLKVRAAGHEILFLGDIEAVHLESHSLRSAFEDTSRNAAWTQAYKVMRARWGAALSEDPTYNPHFSRLGEPFEMITEPSEMRINQWIQRQGRAAV